MTDELRQAEVDRAVEDYRAGAITKRELVQRLRKVMPFARRDRVITVRLTETEYERVRAAAALERRSMNAWVIKMLAVGDE